MSMSIYSLHVNDLPAELLTSIIEFSAEDSLENLSSARSVCKIWYQAGLASYEYILKMYETDVCISRFMPPVNGKPSNNAQRAAIVTETYQTIVAATRAPYIKKAIQDS